MTTRRGPLWTRARLQRVMCLRFGFGATGGVDTRSAAEAMGVSRRTIQRWLHARHGRSIAHIPESRLNQLIGLLQPSGEAVAREAQQVRYAEKAIEALQLPDGLGVKPSWDRQGWLEEHCVVVLDIRVGSLHIRQIASSRTTASRLRELRRRGRVVDQVSIPTRFHATVLIHRALTEMGPWRFQAGDDQVVQGFTQAWIADAPRTDLASWAEESLPTASSRVPPTEHLPR